MSLHRQLWPPLHVVMSIGWIELCRRIHQQHRPPLLPRIFSHLPNCIGVLYQFDESEWILVNFVYYLYNTPYIYLIYISHTHTYTQRLVWIPNLPFLCPILPLFSILVYFILFHCTLWKITLCDIIIIVHYYIYIFILVIINIELVLILVF